MPSLLRKVTSLLSLAVLAGMIAAGPSGAQPRQQRLGEQARPAFPALSLGVNQSGGEIAVNLLGDRLAEVAGWYGKSAAQFRSQLLSDRRMRLDRNGRLFAVEDLDAPLATAPVPAMQDGIQQGTLVSLDRTFALHSRPGANRTLYIDFDGATISGTAWNASSSTINAKPFDVDGNPAVFSAAELQRIQYIWQRVAEDYAPFDVDVTTELPPADRLTRAGTSDQIFGTTVVVTDNTGVYACSCGGIAYVGVFNATSEKYKPAFVFFNKLSAGNEMAVAEAISHEAGHNMGLSHDGTSSTDYYAGQGTDKVTGWAPIMGVGYYKPLVQFSKGEYADANNREDDFAVAQSFGLPLREDDFGDSPAAALPLQADAGATSAVIDGVIETAGDRDVFSLASGAGVITASVSPAARSANADLVLSLVDSSGRVLASANPVNALGASLSFNAQVQGTYFLEVRGTGQGDPATTGYSSYGSVGNFRLSASFAASAGSAPVAAVTASVTSGPGPLSVTLDGSASRDDGKVAFWYWDFGDGSADRTGTLSSVTHVYQAPGDYVARLTVVDDSGLTGVATKLISVSAPALQPSANVVSMALKSSRRGLAASAVVTVVDARGQPIRGAKVTANWSGAVSQLLSRTASADGKASFTSPASKAGGCFNLTVTSISATGYSFGSAALPSAQICG